MVHNFEEKIATVLQEVNLIKIRLVVRFITIVKYSFGSLANCSSWRKRKIPDCSFGILVYMKSLIDLFSIGPIDPLYNMLQQLCLGCTVGYYDMSKSRFVASSQNIFSPGFGGNMASVLKTFNKPEQW